MDTSKLLEIISESFVKPSSPTSPSLRSHKISNMDQVMPTMYNPMAMFYPNIQGSNRLSASQICTVLQLSLSKTLTYYYPFAGRLKNNLFIECNDMGVHFIEAQIKCRISDIINQPNSRLEDLVFPDASDNISPITSNPADASLVLIQLNYFDCGSLAVSMFISHKIADASTMSTFLNDWAAVASQLLSSGDHIPSPQFIGASLFPPVEDPTILKLYTMPKQETCMARRFLFHASKIAELKDMAINSGVDNPTRVEVVTALILKCAMSVSRANSGSFRPTLLRNAANLRQITIPPLPQNSVGNFITVYPVVVENEDEMRLPDLVIKLRNGRKDIQNEYKERHKFDPIEEFQSTLAKREGIFKNFDVYHCSSMCRFPFYDVDFGWGRPSLVRYATKLGQRNSFILMDLRNGKGLNGIQALVTLEKQQMCSFEANDELLTYASLTGENESPYPHGY